MKAAVLPRAYRDAVEIMADAGRAIRAGQIAVAMGMPDEAAKREGLRSKLKRLVERGWRPGRNRRANGWRRWGWSTTPNRRRGGRTM